MTLPAAAAYRDQVLEQGRELLVLDYYALQRIGERKLRRQEQRDIELACKKLHKLA